MAALDAQTPDAVREDVWRYRLLAKMHARYFAQLSERYTSWDRRCRLIQAISSSTVVVAWLLKEQLGWLLEAVSIFAAVVAIVATIYLDPRRIQKLPAIAAHWVHRSAAWDTLWSQIEGGQSITAEMVAQQHAADDTLTGDELQFKFDKKLASDVQYEVERIEAPRNHHQASELASGTAPPSGT